MSAKNVDKHNRFRSITVGFRVSQEEQEEVRRVWLERCESILQECIETRDKQNALKALDLMAKSLGLYKESKDINLDVDGGISFDFS